MPMFHKPAVNVMSNPTEHNTNGTHAASTLLTFDASPNAPKDLGSEALDAVGADLPILRIFSVRAAYDSAKLELNYTEIRAPIKGVISLRNIKVGKRPRRMALTAELYLGERYECVFQRGPHQFLREAASADREQESEAEERDHPVDRDTRRDEQRVGGDHDQDRCVLVEVLHRDRAPGAHQVVAAVLEQRVHRHDEEAAQPAEQDQERGGDPHVAEARLDRVPQGARQLGDRPGARRGA